MDRHNSIELPFHYDTEDPTASKKAMETYLNRGCRFSASEEDREVTMNQELTMLLDVYSEMCISNEKFKLLLNSHFMSFPMDVRAEVPVSFDAVVASMKRAHVLKDVEYIYLCGTCKVRTWTGTARTTLRQCSTCRVIPRNGKPANSEKVFAFFDMPAQFRALFLDEEFAQHVEDHYHNRRKSEAHPMTTVYDASAWEQQEREYPILKNELRHIRASLATDGVSVHNKHDNKKTMYPFVIEILNLSPAIRRKQKYIVIVGFTIGKLAEEKDVFLMIEREIKRRLQALWTQGIDVLDASKEETDPNRTFTCKVMITCTRHDTPAFAKVRHRLHTCMHFNKTIDICKRMVQDKEGRYGQKCVQVFKISKTSLNF